jgi:YbbR domain-containing protein
MLSDKIRLYPNKVTVYGPKHILDTLKIIRTECLIMKNLNDTNTFRVQLSPIKLLRFSTNSTKVGVFVEQFTERKVQLPVTTINCPEHLSVRTFPALVNATFLVGLSQFKKFNANDIQVYLDYNELKANKQSKQVLKIKNNSTHISNIRIFPLNVEFILEQK